MTSTELLEHFRERLRLFASFLVPVVAIGAVLRVVLYCAFRDTGFDALTLAGCVALGAAYDALSTVILLAPVLLGLTFLGVGVARPLTRAFWIVLIGVPAACALAFLLVDRLFGRLHAFETLVVPFVILLSLSAAALLARPVPRALFRVVFCAAMLFNAAIEYFFFEEFNSRFNHIALDYVLYPNEVVTNIWESYDVPLFLGAAFALGALLAWWTGRKLAPSALPRLPWSAAWRGGAIALAAMGLALLALSVLPASISQDRITNEIAQNGPDKLVQAYRTAELDYHPYYCTLPQSEARTRAAKVLGFPALSPESAKLPDASFALLRAVKPARAPSAKPLDVVVVLEESLGSEFVGCVGGKHAGTEHFDRWAKDGLLLENLVANGNRTVRGLEGVLCAFVPLPGDSITKRTPPVEAAALGRVFQDKGYDTAFFYGGAASFDGMEPFMTKNGWQEFVEQKHYPSDAFTTAWGVADEYIFDALLAREERAAKEGRPFFGTLMSVSNHKPYLVPQGRTPAADGKPSRGRAVAYSDWALGRWLDAARAKGLLQHTLVLVVGDHGARVYGAELIPAESYRVPALFLSPDPAWRGKRMPRLCSQIDLAPTLLSLAGIECQVPFLGTDLTSVADGPGRAFVQHNRDVGLLTDNALVVLGLQKTVTFYRREGRASDVLLRVQDRDVTPAMRELEKDATAVFQTAFEMYHAGRYTIPVP
jgi:phosphoglycerol transferase MdoB-like AlkP superfamily enzyme